LVEKASRPPPSTMLSFKDTVNLATGNKAPPDKNLSEVETLSTWNWTKFMGRLELMYEVREAWLADPGNFVVDAAKDPWAEHGPAEIEVLRQEHEQKLQELREKMRERDKEATICSLKATAASAELVDVRQDLRNAQAQLERERQQRIDAEALLAAQDALRQSMTKPRASMIPIPEVKEKPVMPRKSVAGSASISAIEESEANSRVGRCIEMAKASKALLESLYVEQAYGLPELLDSPTSPKSIWPVPQVVQGELDEDDLVPSPLKSVPVIHINGRKM